MLKKIIVILIFILIGSCTEQYKQGVIDKKNYLLWQKCAAGSSGDFCQKGMALRYTWKEAVNYCKKLDLGGLKWKLPNISELMTLQKCSTGFTKNTFIPYKSCLKKIPASERKSCKKISRICKGQTSFGESCIDTKNFPNTEADGFWSSSQNKTNKGEAWGLSFWEGMSQTTSKEHRIFVRCVSTIKK